MASVAVVFVLCAIPAPWYNIHVVGEDFENTMTVNDPGDSEDIMEINGEWTLWKSEISEEPFEVPPEEYFDPLYVNPYVEEDIQEPNANTLRVYENTAVVTVAAIMALSAAAFGAWNIARHDRFRMFTAATWLLAAVMLFGACYYFGHNLPGAMAEDAATGNELAFGRAFEPYINTEGAEPAFYSDFSGGYSNSDPRASEQLEYGPGSGWWLSGMAGVICLFVASLLYAAPQLKPLTRKNAAPREVLRYVPVPVVTSVSHRRYYPRRMPAHNPMSPGHQVPRHPRRVAQVKPAGRRYK